LQPQCEDENWIRDLRTTPYWLQFKFVACNSTNLGEEFLTLSRTPQILSGLLIPRNSLGDEIRPM
jgi:hypothetical protein